MGEGGARRRTARRVTQAAEGEEGSEEGGCEEGVQDANRSGCEEARSSKTRSLGHPIFVIPGCAARRRPGIHTLDCGHGFRARVFMRPGMTGSCCCDNQATRVWVSAAYSGSTSQITRLRPLRLAA